jgi:DNA-binding CsgD family transcriptional regulator
MDEHASRFALRLYEAAVNDDGWNDSVRDLATLFQADMALLQLADIDADRPVSQSALAAHNVGADVIAEYARDHVGHDPWINAVFTRLGAGHVAVLNDYAPVETWANLPRWRHFMSEGFPARHGLGAFFQSDAHDGMTGVVSIFRTGAAGEFRSGADAALQGLLPHIQRAAVVHACFHGPGQALVHALEAIDQAVAMLDYAARPLAMTAAFRQLLGDGWFVHSRIGIVPAEKSATSVFMNLVAAAASAPRYSGPRPVAGEVVVRHPRYAGILLARILPQMRFRPAALIMIHDPSRARPPMPDTLRQAFGLTAAESQLALALLAGETLAEYASRRGVAAPTVRTQLASVFAKTGTTRQATLVRLLASLSG